MSRAFWITGDTLATLRAMPDGCVDLVLTSPPFLALRSYLPDDDPAKPLEIGQEGDPGAFLDALLDITEELRRVIAPHGSIAVELGDTYSSSGGAGGGPDGERCDGHVAFKAHRKPNARTRAGYDRADRPGRGPQVDDDHANRVANVGGPGWPEAKSLCLIPELYRMALAYGRNPLTGRECSRWRIRNVVRWVRPNPPVGALGDKFRPATSEMVIATIARDRYFDLDAVRTEHKVDPTTYTGNGYTKGQPEGVGGTVAMQGNPAGAPPLDWWEIPTHPYKGSHYATFPPALCERPIKSMVPQRVCTVCGKPSERITSEPTYEPSATNRGRHPQERAADGANQWKGEGGAAASVVRTVETLGWSDCGHDAWRTGRVLDIFAGSGTTLAVATGHGRDAIGIDLDRRNADLARERIGMFLTDVTVDELADALTPAEAHA